MSKAASVFYVPKRAKDRLINYLATLSPMQAGKACSTLQSVVEGFDYELCERWEQVEKLLAAGCEIRDGAFHSPEGWRFRPTKTELRYGEFLAA